MSLHFFRFENSADVEHFLNGGITGGKEVVRGGNVLGLDGLTLVFNAPAGTVTFSDPSGAGLSPQEIKTEVETTIATLKVTFKDGRIRFIHAALSSAVNLDLTGTANTLFGFSDATDTAGTRFNPFDGVAPRVLATEANPNADGWAILVELP